MTESSANDKVDIASSIRGKLRREAPSLATTCIYRVPDRIKRLHEKEFVPSLISIGPFHHGKKNLQAMEGFKLWHLNNLLVRLEPKTSLEHIVEKVTSMEEYCRDCYDEKLDVSSEAFVEMMVVDGCFIVEFLRKEAGEVATEKEDLTSVMFQSTVRCELLLLENQMPWRLVDCLFELTNNQVPHGISKSLWELSCRVLPRWVDETREKTSESRHLLDNFRLLSNCLLSNCLLSVKPDNEQAVSTDLQPSEGRHLLDTFRLLSVKPDNEEAISLDWDWLPPATELVKIGVIFKQRGHDNKLGINFNNVDGVMEITPISITAPNQSLLRNLIALEECESRGPHKYQIISYCRVLNDPIKSSKDVEILMKKGIIQNINLSKKDVACFFSDICNNSVATLSCTWSISGVSEKVTEYCADRWLRRWIASIKRDYLYNSSSIWSIANGVVLIILLTVTQTVYSVLSYYKS